MRKINIVRVSRPLPLVGHIAFGVIDRGTNLLQVRPYTLCPFSCIFCSVDAGPMSRSRVAEFIVDIDYLVEWVLYVIRYKVSKKIHILIDGVGEPILHPRIEDLVRELREVERIGDIAIETRGPITNVKILQRLIEAGLSRMNVSIDTLDSLKAVRLTNAKWYSLDKVLETILQLNSMGLDITLTPLWIPGVNDYDIVELVEWSKRNIKNKSAPVIAIQKYVIHKRGRKIPGVREISWKDFYKHLRALEERTGVRLVLKPEDFGVRPDNPLPKPMRVGEKIRARIYSIGWLRGEYIGYARDRVITFIESRDLKEGTEVIGRIIHDKDNIYIARTE